ncbi:hypothetical protein ACFXHA_08980 [Nocardia sp. NPDC059240]|uniref:hypothetical protein n=1 Tax=Nocardia sp. NPDC059240 TaxID=3346786 RepID=UPI0036AE7E37
MTMDPKKLQELREHYDTHGADPEIAAAEAAGTIEYVAEPEPAALAGYSVRLPVPVLEAARNAARSRGISTGAWLREAIEAAVTSLENGTDTVPISVLLAAVEEYRHRKAS